MNDDYIFRLTTARLAIQEGRWSDARDAFEQARLAGLTGEATEGLADAHRWLGDSATVYCSARWHDRAGIDLHSLQRGAAQVPDGWGIPTATDIM
jgi:hypothetical protein